MSFVVATNKANKALPNPGVVWGSYPQRRQVARGATSWQRWQRLWLSQQETLMGKRPMQKSLQHFSKACLTSIGSLQAQHAGLAQAQTIEKLIARINSQRAEIAKFGLQDDLVTQLTAALACLSHEVLGKLPYPVQLMAVKAILDNKLAEMATGEGKTLVVGLAAALVALIGVPVIVVTANDYLVKRDRELMQALFDRLNLSHAHIERALTPEQRRDAYGKTIVYCTAKELSFDYLRDLAAVGPNGAQEFQHAKRLVGLSNQSPPMLRGLCMAIIDEADSILLDEAGTPLILSKAVDDPVLIKALAQAMSLAKPLSHKQDYRIDASLRQCLLLEPGEQRLNEACMALGTSWRTKRYREELVVMALNALHLYNRDRDYVVQNGEVQMIDLPTGRVAVGRKWSRGLHQLIELKEGVNTTSQTETMGQITFQRFFPRFLRLAGISGSLSEASSELKSVYHLQTVSIPHHKPVQRQFFPTVLFASARCKWRYVLNLVQALHRQRRPILLGTDSVASARELSRLLKVGGFAHHILTAGHEEHEAQIVAKAGQPGSITVTTNLAGRGTDIHVDSATEAIGGLAVIACHLNAERRIDRQLFGRAGRQGQKGSVHIVVSLDDSLFIKSLSKGLDGLLRRLWQDRPQQGYRWLTAYAQRRQERSATRQRLVLLEQQQQNERLLAMAGKIE